jgi:hypothetical protein
MHARRLVPAPHLPPEHNFWVVRHSDFFCIRYLLPATDLQYLLILARIVEVDETTQRALLPGDTLNQPRTR